MSAVDCRTRLYGQVHWIVSGALDRAVVWKWIPSNPAQQADKPPLPHPDPKPPSPEEAARLVERAAACRTRTGVRLFGCR